MSVVTTCKTTNKPRGGGACQNGSRVPPPRGFSGNNQFVTTNMSPLRGLKVKPVRKSCVGIVATFEKLFWLSDNFNGVPHLNDLSA